MIDREGRVMAIILPDIVVINTYVPTLQLDLSGTERKNHFYEVFNTWAADLKSKHSTKRLLWVGDLNVCNTLADHDRFAVRFRFGLREGVRFWQRPIRLNLENTVVMQPGETITTRAVIPNSECNRMTINGLKFGQIRSAGVAARRGLIVDDGFGTIDLMTRTTWIMFTNSNGHPTTVTKGTTVAGYEPVNREEYHLIGGIEDREELRKSRLAASVVEPPTRETLLTKEERKTEYEYWKRKGASSILFTEVGTQERVGRLLEDLRRLTGIQSTM